VAYDSTRSGATWSTTRPSIPRRAAPIRAAHHRVPPVGLDTQLVAGLHQRRVRRPLAGARVEPGVRAELERGSALRDGRRRDRPRAALHGGVRHRSRCRGRAPPGRLLDEPRGAHPPLRGGAHPSGLLTGDWVDCSAHMLWVGERTRQLDGAHVEFLSGVINPLGAKLGPSATPDDVVALCARLDPDRTPGRLTLITRFGAGRVEELLPPLLDAVRAEGHPVVWQCDPMHGNTFTSDGGRKTRRFDDILAELRSFFAVHRGRGRGPVACTSSSPVTTSPSAWASRGDLRRRSRPALHHHVRSAAQRQTIAGSCVSHRRTAPSLTSSSLVTAKSGALRRECFKSGLSAA